MDTALGVPISGDTPASVCLEQAYPATVLPTVNAVSGVAEATFKQKKRGWYGIYLTRGSRPDAGRVRFFGCYCVRNILVSKARAAKR